MWNYELVHDNLRIWEPCQIEVFQRLRSEFYHKSYARTTLFYIHGTKHFLFNPLSHWVLKF